MKKILLCLIIFIAYIKPVNATEFWAKNYIVMEQSSLQVLEGKDIHQTQSVASISKIMTAIIVLENVDLRTMITIGEEINRAYGSGIYIHIGDEITIQDLLYGLMLRSGNDAALALAYYVGEDSVENFVELMNNKAIEIGMKNTVFSNPSGLDEEDLGNVSSVYDMGLLMSYCLNNEQFKQIASTTSYKRLDGKGTWKNKNKLLDMYEYTTAGKTGFTKKAKRTLISSAKKDGVELIVVTFNCGDDFMFHKSLFESYFNLYNQVLWLNRGIHRVDDYYFEADKPLFYPMDYSLKDTSFLNYEIIENEAIVNVYLNIKDEKIFLSSYSIKKNRINWFLKVFNGEKL
jgi:D-alanyl-D-alanine carboxypeptidase